jgi:hypothetical protein
MADETFLQDSNALIPPANDGIAGGTINAPQLNPETMKAGQRAISNIEHIFQIISTLEEARREQNEKNGRIMAKYNAERPFSQTELKDMGLDWMSNFSTKPLAIAIDKVSPRLTRALQTARYLTSAQLPASVPGYKDKSDRFRRKITEVIRGWDNWTDFINEVAQEDAIFGFTSVAWLDEYSWRPSHFRQDSFFVPDGTPQNITGLQLWIGKQYLMIHELAAFVLDKDSAEAAGWNIENTVEAINNAKPRSVTGAGNTSPYTDFRAYEDAIRESSVSLSLLSGSKTIEIYHVYVPEYTGKVSHYIVDGRAKKILFQKLDQFDRIPDVLALFSFQQANGKLMGSKGVGRELYELAAAVDRNRNAVVDRLQLSGKILIQGEARQLNRFALSVVGNAVLIPANYTVAQQGRIEANVDSFLALDAQLVSFMDQIAGGVTPRAFGRERTTASEVNLFASREEEKRDAILERFLTQMGAMVTTCQRRIINPQTDDEDAKDAREYLLQFMSQEELDLIASQPALRTVDDWTEMEAQKIALFADAKRADPLYNQEKLQKMGASAVVNAEFAEDVLLPQPDPTVIAEQARQQALENILLERGNPVPVSPRDNHQVHIEVVKALAAATAEQLSQPNEQVLAVFEQVLTHWNEHINAAVAAGAPKDQYAEDLRQITESAKQMGELQAVLAASQQAQAGGLPPGAEGMAPEQMAAPVEAGV